MGRKRKQVKKHTVENDSDDDFENMPVPDPESEDYFIDDIEKYSLKKDKILLDEAENESDEESDDFIDEEDEIMKVDDDDESGEEDDEGIDFEEGNDDILEKDEENDAGLPSRKAWGRKKKEFYDSNLKDATHFENEEEEEMVAEEEEKEAMALQQRMISHLDQQDFDFFELEQEQPVDDKEEILEIEEQTQIVKDLCQLSKEEKIQILMKDSPEIFVLLDDYQSKLSQVINKYHPLLLIARTGGIMSKQGREFIEIMHQLLLNYCINISFYLSLKAKRENVKDHPVIEKLIEYRNLLTKIEPIAKRLEDEMENAMQQSINANDILLNGENLPASKNLRQLAKEANSLETIISTTKVKSKSVSKKVKAKKSTAETPVQNPWEYYNSIANKAKEKKKIQMEADELNGEGPAGDDEEDEEGKRAITYEMAKNKGLTRKRKKEHRNPRVKHKMKFKKALVKRKSQVPLVRNQASSYGGELTGISSRVRKSVKIK